MSHLSYKCVDGFGVAMLPPEKERELAEHMVADALRGMWHAIAQVCPKEGYGPFYLDLDGETAEAPTDEWLDAFLAQVIAAVRCLFPGVPPSDERFGITVATSGVRLGMPLKSGGIGCKVGIHVYFPRLPANLEMMLVMAAYVRMKTYTTVAAAGFNPEKFVDDKVYGNGKGLRWVWVLKSTPCPKCKAVTRAFTCTNCGRKAMAKSDPKDVIDPTASMYVPAFRMDGTGTRTVTFSATKNTPDVDLMLECSVRSPVYSEPCSGFVIPVDAPSVRNAKTNMYTDDATADKVVKKPLEITTLSPAALAALELALQRYDTHYASVKVREVKEMQYAQPGRRGYLVFLVRGVDARYCTVVGRHHDGDNVFFTATPKGLQLHCGSDTCKAAGAVNRGVLQEFTLVESQHLFGDILSAAPATVSMAAAATKDNVPGSALSAGGGGVISGSSGGDFGSDSGAPLVIVPVPHSPLLSYVAMRQKDMMGKRLRLK